MITLFSDIDIKETVYPNGEIGYTFDKYDSKLGYLLQNDGCVLVEFTYEKENLYKDLMKLYFVAKHIKNQGYDIRLQIRYMPFSRMDRVKNCNEVFTLKYICNFINSIGFRKVYILDAHSDVTPALIDNCVVTYPVDKVKSIFYDYGIDYLCFPDAGAYKKYKDIYTLPYVIGTKNRDWKSGMINSLTIETCGNDLSGKDVLIVDDICSKGGTFILAAQALKRLGVKDIYLFVTHCEDTIYSGKVLHDCSPIKKVFYENLLFSEEKLNQEDDGLGKNLVHA